MASALTLAPMADAESVAMMRKTILITHANPEDNEIARWLAARLTMAGYSVWVDVRSLKGGNDFWDVIERTLRQDAIKQIVLVSEHVRKSGVMKELALGDYIGKQLNDPDFMIPIRVGPIPFGEFPPELLRRNAFDAHPNWAAVLKPVLETLEEAGVPRSAGPATGLLREIVDAQEHGRKAVTAVPETLFSNWFELSSKRPDLWIFEPRGTIGQLDAWAVTTRVPHVRHDNRIVALCNADAMADIDGHPPSLKARACLPFNSVVDGSYTQQFGSTAEARKIVVNLLRQHWDNAMQRRGLLPVNFSGRTRGWFFPDGLIAGSVKLTLPRSQRIDRVLSGKFKERRWHLCLVAQPKLWPHPLIRVHANVAVTTDGKTPLPGEQLHRLRLRLTRSWWNDKWRDMLLAALGWLSEGTDEFSLAVGSEKLSIHSIPIEVAFPLTFAADEERVSEEAADGSIELSEELDTAHDEDLTVAEEDAA